MKVILLGRAFEDISVPHIVLGRVSCHSAIYPTVSALVPACPWRLAALDGTDYYDDGT